MMTNATATTVPTTAIRISVADTSDYPVRADLATRARIAAERPQLADDMRVGVLSVYIDAPDPSCDPDLTPDTRHAYIVMVEHTDPLNPDATVTRFSEIGIA